ncbi:HdeD family acid-resistance protein [Dyadobacter sp. NIV53]|uniref:HdeD family acid-resistance protein n=1 Tax=Dyadobacter sp. NIV53 TaxID=2861765 RepID=UPI001C88553D|nr:DUF308 domain-containing protein [Dyadobacter sp. NIV53]
MEKSFLKGQQSLRFWWIFLFSGVALLSLGVSVFIHPTMMLAAFSLYFAVAFFVNGLLEVFFTLTNHKIIRDWKWFLLGGAFDLLICSSFVTNPILSAAYLPLIVGVWLLCRSMAVIGRAHYLKQWAIINWKWALFFGIAGLFFSWINIYSPLFAIKITVTWTGIALLTSGVFYIYYSITLKTLAHRILTH